ncbi:Fic family protein [Segatella oris]|jgi:toxin-antitoxin system, toxin component, fic family|uniref:Mobile mystery protein B n=1 Tax=Segatella oris TaxID=28135 RepID=A0A448L4V7_9BACT|nr:Fic family protein [Segatella oris]VEH14990.1 mobile mystery protein B [Segatella oris]
MYIHERENWTDFHWENSAIDALTELASRKIGLLYGRLNNLGFDNKLQAMAENLTHDVVQSSEIEGVSLNTEEVRSSIARHLGIDNVKYTAPSHYVESVVKVMLDAVEHYMQPLTKETLCRWQSAFFPTGYSDGFPVEVGCYRTHEEHIVSGIFGRERIHYIAPAPQLVENEMTKFIQWFNQPPSTSSIVQSGIAHLWFVSIHPFEDGNGRLARILSDILLAKSDKNEFRFYNISAEINRNKKQYYNILEQTQHGNGDITAWLTWYIKTLIASVEEAETSVNSILNKSFFWQRNASVIMTDRQTQVINLFLDGYEAKITSKTWAVLGNCSKDTAIRDIQDLVTKGVLREEIPGAKRPCYAIVYDPEDLTSWFSDTRIEEENGTFYLLTTYKGKQKVRNRLLRLDVERYMKGNLSLQSLLNKYCAYLMDASR